MRAVPAHTHAERDADEWLDAITPFRRRHPITRFTVTGERETGMFERRIRDVVTGHRRRIVPPSHGQAEVS